ncbi:uridine diphosphate-N-acetylglucosamine-binding protein YvcK [Arachnia propionica]|uniref:Putative gluconeogenesis factor n=1 Tax=Arachnia propionica TaxID=1750 RepID=A0A3P1T877_9ACTN|nr:uridine diphosphate-N-acetylglucosamine-binding protein YvcK [Arachnia propionica]MDO5084118.1 uridine diphosphate-N-acetylglucosamine-binding protein YvcK [Arachnia propionica]RRD05697.1 uridine diphosphate-N-acetylglucosamine-binding protein YvcK [Arachnia propionica]
MKTLSKLPKVVAFGGGHGLYASLSALRRVTDRLTAVVTVADDGGSSGRLRSELGCLPPGDLRMALAALCGDDKTGRAWASVLQSRFGGDGPLAGHAIGNLLIAGLWQQLDDPVAGLDMVGDLLRTRGRVLPMSAVPLQIEAEVLGLDPLAPDEICTLAGQATVAKTRATVQAVRLVPEDPPAHPEAVAAVEEAHAIVLGPGSWFTSVIPHLLVPQLRDAILTTSARRILVLNIAAAEETDGFSASRHIELLAEHAPTLRLDVVLADSRFAACDRHLAKFAASLGAEVVMADVGVHDGSPRHDPNRLAAAYSELLIG